MENTLSIEEVRERSPEMRPSESSKRIKARVALGKRGRAGFPRINGQNSKKTEAVNLLVNLRRANPVTPES